MGFAMGSWPRPPWAAKFNVQRLIVWLLLCLPTCALQAEESVAGGT